MKLIVVSVLLALLDHLVALVTLVCHPAALRLVNAQFRYFYKLLTVEAGFLLDVRCLYCNFGLF